MSAKEIKAKFMLVYTTYFKIISSIENFVDNTLAEKQLLLLKPELLEIFPPYSTVLLATALVDIVPSEQICSAKAFIDSAPRPTFISRILQEKLELYTFSTPLMVSMKQ